MISDAPVRTAKSLEALVRPVVDALPAYHRDEAPAGQPKRQLRLDWNESPYGPSPKTRDALASFTATNRYPPFDAAPLREALGAYIDAPADQIIVGAGLDDVLNTVATAIIDPGDRVIISEPTFGVYRPLFATHGAEIVDVPLRVDFGFALDAEAIIGAIDDRTKLVIVCNPNNPTGHLFAADAVERVVAESRCFVAIDEAYAEFAGVAHRSLMARYPNLIVLRTMSKFAGLAGLRVGYGVMPEALAPYVRRVMPAFGNVSTIASDAAIASLDDLPYLREIVARILADRDDLAASLGTLDGVSVVPSATNFLLVDLGDRDGAGVVRALGERGVYVRSFGHPALRRCLRVSVGTAEENRGFFDELGSVLAEAAVKAR